jgi:hypothetical protein
MHPWQIMGGAEHGARGQKQKPWTPKPERYKHGLRRSHNRKWLVMGENFLRNNCAATTANPLDLQAKLSGSWNVSKLHCSGNFLVRRKCSGMMASVWITPTVQCSLGTQRRQQFSSYTGLSDVATATEDGGEQIH